MGEIEGAEITRSLARIEALLTIAVGEDGNRGRLGDIDQRVRSLEVDRGKLSGFSAAIGAIFGTIVSLLTSAWWKK